MKLVLLILAFSLTAAAQPSQFPEPPPVSCGQAPPGSDSCFYVDWNCGYDQFNGWYVTAVIQCDYIDGQTGIPETCYRTWTIATQSNWCNQPLARLHHRRSNPVPVLTAYKPWNGWDIVHGLWASALPTGGKN